VLPRPTSWWGAAPALGRRPRISALRASGVQPQDIFPRDLEHARLRSNPEYLHVARSVQNLNILTCMLAEIIKEE